MTRLITIPLIVLLKLPAVKKAARKDLLASGTTPDTTHTSLPATPAAKRMIIADQSPRTGHHS